jgi:hypothetical protein
MRIAVTIHSLAGLGGTETYVSTLGDHLQRNGHEVWVYARERGPGADLADSFGLRVVTDAHELPDDLDVAIPQDAPATLDVFAVHPKLPQVFVSHTELFDVGLPPQVDGALQLIVTLYDRADARVRALSVETPVERLRQPVDIERFKPTRVLPERARRAVSFGNYMSGSRLELLRAACADAGVELETAGGSGGALDLHPEAVFNEYDIVFGKAKVVHEAMGCGRAVYVLDHNGAEGWVTPKNYERLVADNFGGRSEPRILTRKQLAEELRLYDPAMGTANRDLIVANHDAVAHAAALTELVRRYVGKGAAHADPGNAEELARLTRVNWRHQSDAFQTRKLLELRDLELGDARWRAEVAEAELAAARQELTDVRRELDRHLQKNPLRRLARKKS